MALKIHAGAGIVSGMTLALCGWFDVRVTDDADAVTCQRCARRIREAAAVRVVEAGGVLYRGERLHLLRSAVEGLCDAIAGQHAGPRAPVARHTRWRGIGHALTAMVLADVDGATTGSISDPDRMDRLAGRMGGPTTGGTETLADDLCAVRAAWEGALEAVDASPLSPAQARTAGLLRYVGAEIDHPERGPEIRPLTPAIIAAEFAVRGWTGLSPADVGHVTAALGRHVYAHLHPRGLVPARNAPPDPQQQTRRSTTMTQPLDDYDLRGWTAIAHFLGVSVRTAQRYDSELGMPVHRFRGLAYPEASRTEIRDWRERQRLAAAEALDEASEAPPGSRVA